jgi:hypothetical protein
MPFGRILGVLNGRTVPECRNLLRFLAVQAVQVWGISPTGEKWERKRWPVWMLCIKMCKRFILCLIREELNGLADTNLQRYFICEPNRRLGNARHFRNCNIFRRRPFFVSLCAERPIRSLRLLAETLVPAGGVKIDL